MKNDILRLIGPAAYNFIEEYVQLESEQTSVVVTTNPFNIKHLKKDATAIVNLRKVNGIRYINKFFKKVNQKLEVGQYYICCSETIVERHKRQRINRIPILRNLFHFGEFIFLRVFPKVWGFKKIYFLVTRGRRRLLSKAETLGRLVCCGFDIEETRIINGLLFIVAKKKESPKCLKNVNVSYGPLFKMNRMGKNGKIIGVYKFRTMHPYSEFLQDYILKINGYADSGKPKDDFRLTNWGGTMRKYWIDEVPQLINVLKGELKLVGVRPISERYFQDIPKDLQELRLKHKPGCIPPYVALNKKSNVQSVLDAEREYLLMKNKRPYTTDTKLFFKALYNIIIRRKRSA